MRSAPYQSRRKYAQEWNGISLTVEGFVAKRALLHRLCREINRDPGEISISLTGTAIIGRDDQDYARRLARVANILGPEKGVGDATPDELMDKGWIVGTPDRVVERILAYSEAGASRVIFQLYDYEDTELCWTSLPRRCSLASNSSLRKKETIRRGGVGGAFP